MMKITSYALTAGLVVRLKSIADARDEVAMVIVKSGHTVFIEPTAFGAVLGVGRSGEAGRDVHMDRILQRRFADPVRYGIWLPARLADQSSFLLRRLSHAEWANAAQLDSIDFSIPMELLAS